MRLCEATRFPYKTAGRNYSPMSTQPSKPDDESVFSQWSEDEIKRLCEVPERERDALKVDASQASSPSLAAILGRKTDKK